MVGLWFGGVTAIELSGFAIYDLHLAKSTIFGSFVFVGDFIGIALDAFIFCTKFD